jgi:hypothetical protein
MLQLSTFWSAEPATNFCALAMKSKSAVLRSWEVTGCRTHRQKKII